MKRCLKRCAFWVSKRQYSDPGPCENRLDIKVVPYEGDCVLACPGHRAMLGRGQHLRLVESVRAGQRAVTKAMRRAVAA